MRIKAFAVRVAVILGRLVFSLKRDAPGTYIRVFGATEGDVEFCFLRYARGGDGNEYSQVCVLVRVFKAEK